MKSLFNKRFEEEFLVSEKLRAKILAGIFLFGLLYAAILILFFNHSVPDDLKKGGVLRIFLFLCSLFLFEILCLIHINRHMKRSQQKISAVAQYLHSIFEITAPGTIMILLSGRFLSPERVLHSPAVYIYFIFIILSTLRLNYRICLFMGLLAAIEFFVVSHILILSAAKTAPDAWTRIEYFATTGKAILLFSSGIGAAFVARRIKIGVDRSLMVAEQGNRIINLFGQQVSKEVVDEMMDRGGLVPAKLMRVCIMFIDIRNFTRYASEKTPAEIAAYQNAFFEIIVKCVLRHNGIINQFLGDGCMVTFGAPVALHNPSLHAIHAALEIRQQLNREIARGNISLTNIGIGIHEGEVVTGNIGPAERQQYSITGSVVILAARIEQLNKEYNSQILVSENVMEQIKATLPAAAEYIGKVNLKGWTDAIGIYRVA